MKVMAIFNEPRTCLDCPLFDFLYDGIKWIDNICKLNGETLYTTDRPEWCPLKEVKEDGSESFH